MKALVQIAQTVMQSKNWRPSNRMFWPISECSSLKIGELKSAKKLFVPEPMHGSVRGAACEGRHNRYSFA
jgi:hypothetical protein